MPVVVYFVELLMVIAAGAWIVVPLLVGGVMLFSSFLVFRWVYARLKALEEGVKLVILCYSGAIAAIFTKTSNICFRVLGFKISVLSTIIPSFWTSVCLMIWFVAWLRQKNSELGRGTISLPLATPSAPTMVSPVTSWLEAWLQKTFIPGLRLKRQDSQRGKNMRNIFSRIRSYMLHRHKYWKYDFRGPSLSSCLKFFLWAVFLLHSIKLVGGTEENKPFIRFYETIQPIQTMTVACKIKGKCPLPGSSRENVTRKHCFKCPPGKLPYCVTDRKNWGIYYICATVEDMTCDRGYVGEFRHANGMIVFEKKACEPGTFLNRTHDCKHLKCEEIPRIDLNIYSILRQATFNGIPFLLRCNKEKGLCVIDPSYGENFTYTHEINYRDVCGKPTPDKDCVYLRDKTDITSREVSTNSHVSSPIAHGTQTAVSTTFQEEPENSTRPRITEHPSKQNLSSEEKTSPTDQTPLLTSAQSAEQIPRQSEEHAKDDQNEDKAENDDDKGRSGVQTFFESHGWTLIIFVPFLVVIIVVVLIILVVYMLKCDRRNTDSRPIMDSIAPQDDESVERGENSGQASSNKSINIKKVFKVYSGGTLTYSEKVNNMTVRNSVTVEDSDNEEEVATDTDVLLSEESFTESTTESSTDEHSAGGASVDEPLELGRTNPGC